MPRNGSSEPPDLIWLGEGIQEFQLPSYNVYPLLPSCTFHSIIGPYKEGKSFAALELATAVAYGLPFFAKWPIDVSGPVLYIAGEGEMETQQRFEAIKRSRGLGPGKIAIWRDPINLREPSDRRKLLVSLMTWRFVLVIVDTASRCGAGDEGSEDMPQFVEGITELQKTYPVTFTVIHHTPDSDRNKARGHSSFPAALGSAWIMKKDKKTGRFVLSEAFNRSGPGDSRIASFTIEPYELGVNEQGRTCSVGMARYQATTERQDQVLELLKKGKTLREVAEALKVSFGTVQAEKATLVSMELWKDVRQGRPNVKAEGSEEDSEDEAEGEA